MTSRTFVQAMYEASPAAWSDAYALGYLLQASVAFQRGIATAKELNRYTSDVDEALTTYREFLDRGLKQSQIRAAMCEKYIPNVGRTDSPPDGDRHRG